MSILTMSLTGGVFIAVTLLLRAIFQHIVPRRTFLILWIAANLLLLIPLRLPLPTSIYTLASPEPAAMTVQTFAAQMSDAVQSVPTGGQAPLPLYTIIWLAGAVLLLSCALFVHGRNLQYFRFAIPVKEHPAELPGWVRVKRLDGLSTPLTYGILHPTILLPAEASATEEQLRHIYLHELCHIRHFDVLRKYILLLTLAIHWFNPLVWLMTYAAMQDMEMRCDAQVVRALGAKKAYANTLVQMETGKMQRILETGFSFSSTNSRLKALLKAKRLGRFSILLALVMCISTVLVFATDAAAQEQKAIVPDTQTIAAPPPAAEPKAPEPTITPTEPQKPEPIPEKPEEDPLPVSEEELPKEPEEAPPEEPEPTPPKEPETAPPQPEPDPEPQEPTPEEVPEPEVFPEEPGPIGTLPTESPLPAYLGEVYLACGETWSYSFSADRAFIAGTNDSTGYNHAIGAYANGTQTVTVIAGAPGSFPVWIAPANPGYPETYLLTVIVTEGEN